MSFRFRKHFRLLTLEDKFLTFPTENKSFFREDMALEPIDILLGA